MDDSCEYIELSILDSRQGLVIELGLGEGLTIPYRKKPLCYEMLQTASDLAQDRDHRRPL
jgi:hypothetical protein